MKSILFAIILVCLSSSVRGQDKSTFSFGSDTSFWYPYMTAIIDTFGEKKTQVFSETRVFRFSNVHTLLTLVADKNNFSGSLSMVATETGEKSLGRTFKKRFDLSQSQVQEAFRLVDSSRIGDIPSQKFIEAWQQGFDGVEYLFEEKRDSLFSFRSYWSPRVQEGVPEAVRVLSFVNSLDSVVKRKELSSTFQAQIPFDSWTYPGSGVGFVRVKPVKNRKFKGKSQ
jgi:hypothetical protein